MVGELLLFFNALLHSFFGVYCLVISRTVILAGMLLTSVKTHKIKPGESIFEILDYYLTRITENSVVAIASKIISIAEGQLISKTTDRMKVIQKEACYCFSAPKKEPNFCLTLKNQRLIPNAGVDESNCSAGYVLLPKRPQLTAKKIWQYLRQKHHCKNLGVIITDSNITPLRTGVTGIAIGWCGFKPIYSYIGQKDIFGNLLKVTTVNLLDSLATAATLMMGEGKEQTPLVVINHPAKVVFQKRAPTRQEERVIYISPKNDLFSTVISYE